MRNIIVQTAVNEEYLIHIYRRLVTDATPTESCVTFLKK